MWIYKFRINSMLFGRNVSEASAIETCEAIFKCMDYVKRKITIAFRHPPSESVAVRDQFGNTVHDHRVKHDVPKRHTFDLSRSMCSPHIVIGILSRLANCKYIFT